MNNISNTFVALKVIRSHFPGVLLVVEMMDFYDHRFLYECQEVGNLGQSIS